MRPSQSRRTGKPEIEVKFFYWYRCNTYHEIEIINRGNNNFALINRAVLFAQMIIRFNDNRETKNTNYCKAITLLLKQITAIKVHSGN